VSTPNKYLPHQGTAECTRRVRQAARREVKLFRGAYARYRERAEERRLLFYIKRHIKTMPRFYNDRFAQGC
jgi:hypothetical protein